MIYTMTKLQFVSELPPIVTHGRPRKYTALANAVRERPGEWAIVEKTTKRNRASSVTSRLRSRYGLQTAVRKDERGVITIFARSSDKVGEV